VHTFVDDGQISMREVFSIHVNSSFDGLKLMQRGAFQVGGCLRTQLPMVAVARESAESGRTPP